MQMRTGLYRNQKLPCVGLGRSRRGEGRDRRGEDRRPGGSQHPHQGGDRLSGVEVVFVVAGQRYPLDERAATLMAENLRVTAAHEPGAEGAVGARPVADAIELRLIEDTADPVTLGGDGAEAVYYALNVPTGIPLRYELDATMQASRPADYLDPEAAKAAIEAVANQGKK